MSYLAICPTGTVFAFAGTAAPNGWLLCTGSAVSRTTYAQLWSAIGSSCGSGDGSTTFNVPDLRGRWIRGVDGGTSRDPNAASRTSMNSGGNTGNAVGSVQGQATGVNGLANANTNLEHSHATNGAGGHTHSILGSSFGGFEVGNIGESDRKSAAAFRNNNAKAYFQTNPDGTNWISPVADHTHGVQNALGNHSHTVTGDAETRPINAYMNYIIKV